VGVRRGQAGTRSCAKRASCISAGALFSSITLAENIALPLQQYTSLPKRRSGNWRR
jgi:ABC-type transporter Mla maintaining outer membrane lipid asymmetry ATPase subunit MlaF